jgi:hypothetical protein
VPNQDELEQMQEAAEDQVFGIVAVLKVAVANEEFHTLQAQNTRKLYDAFRTQGFDADQSLELTVASLGRVK